MVKVLCIAGSARPDSYSTQALRALIQAAGEKNCELVRLADVKIEHCDGSNVCMDKGECWKKDDMDGLLTKCRKADAIVLASPTYYSNVSGLLKDFIDRCLPAYYDGGLKGKVGLSIVAEQVEGAMLASKCIGEYFRHHGMVSAGELMLRNKFDDTDRAAVEAAAKTLLAMVNMSR